MNYPTTTFIGAGNMARSLIGGLLADGWPIECLRIADPNPAQLEIVRQGFGPLFATDNNRQAIAGADVILVAVKPQQVHDVATDIAEGLAQPYPLVISIAAGIRSQDLSRWLGGAVPVVRCMPNTPALVRSGATGLFAGPEVSESQREVAERILRSVGLTLWVEDEDLVNTITALSGSGPAYFLYVMEAMEAAAIGQGLAPEAARLLVLETALGTAKLALESEEGPAKLRQRVTSKGGTTERALAELGDLRRAFESAIAAAAARARELENELGAQ